MPWPEYLTRNFGWKLFALVLSTLIWFSLQDAPQTALKLAENPITIDATREFYKIPVSVLASAGRSQAFSLQPTNVAVYVQGEPEALEQLREEEIEAFVNASAVRDKNGLPRKVRVHTPAGVNVKRIIPEYVTVSRLPDSGPDQSTKP